MVEWIDVYFGQVLNCSYSMILWTYVIDPFSLKWTYILIAFILEKLSGDYYKATASNNCLQSHIVSTKEECKTASNELSLNFQELTKSQKEDLTKQPAGCFWYKDFGDMSSFNPTIEVSKIKLSQASTSTGGVCKHAGL